MAEEFATAEILHDVTHAGEFDPTADHWVAEDVRLSEEALGRGEVYKPRFEVTDDQTAMWALDKIRKWRERTASVRALAAARRAEIDEYVRVNTAHAERMEEWCVSLLEKYARQAIDPKAKSKTYKLPGGEVKLRKQEPEYLGRDDPGLVGFAKEVNPALVEETLRWSSLKAIATRGNPEIKEDPNRLYVAVVVDAEKGELARVMVPAVTLIDRPDKASVTLSTTGVEST